MTILFDALCWALALIIAAVLRYDFSFVQVPWNVLSGIIMGVCVLQCVFGWVLHLYRGRFACGSFEEARSLVATAVLAGLLVEIFVLWFGPVMDISRSLGFVSLPIAVLLMFSLRYLHRLFGESRNCPGPNTQRTLIFGAGYVGSGLGRSFVTSGLPTATIVVMSLPRYQIFELSPA